MISTKKLLVETEGGSQKGMIISLSDHLLLAVICVWTTCVGRHQVRRPFSLSSLQRASAAGHSKPPARSFQQREVAAIV